MTYDVYARALSETGQKAISFLPDFGNISTEKSLCVSLCKDSRELSISADNHRQENGQNTHINALLADSKIAPRGFEPLSPG